MGGREGEREEGTERRGEEECYVEGKGLMKVATGTFHYWCLKVLIVSMFVYRLTLVLYVFHPFVS